MPALGTGPLFLPGAGFADVTGSQRTSPAAKSVQHDISWASREAEPIERHCTRTDQGMKLGCNHRIGPAGLGRHDRARWAAGGHADHSRRVRRLDIPALPAQGDGSRRLPRAENRPRRLPFLSLFPIRPVHRNSPRFTSFYSTAARCDAM